jgi:hypothetical protein
VVVEPGVDAAGDLHYHVFLLIPEIFGLHFAVRACNRKLVQIRKEEGVGGSQDGVA